jgi:hypothetical protein
MGISTCIIVLFLNVHFMNQKIHIIEKAFAVGTEVSISGDTLLFLSHPSGIGSVSWFFELPDKKLAVVGFRWNVKPNASVRIHKKLLRTEDITSELEADLKYEFYYNVDSENLSGSWIRLFGRVGKNTGVDVKIAFPFWTDTSDKVFVEMLRKYKLTIKHQIPDTIF